jgi:hypothetical protein
MAILCWAAKKSLRGTDAVLRIRDVYPGSDFFPSQIRIKEFKPKKPKKWFLSSRKYDPDPDADFLPIPDPGSRGQKGTGSRIRISNTAKMYRQKIHEKKFKISNILCFYYQFDNIFLSIITKISTGSGSRYLSGWFQFCTISGLQIQGSEAGKK